MTIYINGAYSSSTTSTYLPAKSSSQEIAIGARTQSPGTDARFDGSIDEVRIYERALSSNEVADIYEEFIPLPPTNGPVLHYTFDEDTGTNVLDQSGSGNDAVAFGAVRVADPEHGWVCEFDGLDDYLEVTGYKGVLGHNPMSISVWAKSDIFKIGGHRLVSWGDGAQWGGAFILSFNGAGNRGVHGSVGGWHINGATGGLNGDGLWHHLAFSTDGNMVWLYVDGVLDGFVDADNGVNVKALNDVLVGHDGGANFLKGAMDDVRIYDRALSSNEVADIYKEFIPLPPTNGLVLHYTLDEDTGTNVLDSSGNGHHAVATGTTRTSAGASADALLFDGTNSKVVVFETGLDLVSNFTVCAWIRPDRYIDGGSPILAKTDQQAFSTRSVEFQMAGEEKLECYFWDSSSQYFKGTCTVPGLSSGSWQFVVVQHDTSLPDHQMRMYANGAEAALSFPYETVSSITAVRGAAVPWSVGFYAGTTTDRYFDGAIDDVRIYDRVLTPSQIAALYGEHDLPQETPTFTGACVPVSLGRRIAFTWCGREGQAYDLWWSTNLLEGFELLLTNLLCEGSNTIFESDFDVPDRCFFSLELAD